LIIKCKLKLVVLRSKQLLKNQSKPIWTVYMMFKHTSYTYKYMKILSANGDIASTRKRT